MDEADWLRLDSMEAARAVFDQGGPGLVLIGMPGAEKRPARHSQFYSRIGFAHTFRPLGAAEVRSRIAEIWPLSSPLPCFEAEAMAVVIRITEGDFRLLDRLLSQMRRIIHLNHLPLGAC